MRTRGPSVKVVDASFLIERAAEARALLKLGLDTPRELEKALSDSGWTLHRASDGSIDDLDFSGPTLSAEFNAVLGQLGPFVAGGSFVVLENDEGVQCRWDFDGRECHFVDLGLAAEAV
ncbi:MAG TPA: hypothetical protein VGK67_12265 [Myxococcales bacterium]|jgi:hypothetical protein